MYFLNDDKKKRYFVIPPVSKPHSRQYNIHVYGGIYLMSDFEEYSNALYSFYNCSFKYVNKITEQDLYIPSLYSIKPIKFNTLDDIDNCTYSKLDNIEGLVMLGNQNNQLVKNQLIKADIIDIITV